MSKKDLYITFNTAKLGIDGFKHRYIMISDVIIALQSFLLSSSDEQNRSLESYIKEYIGMLEDKRDKF
ncbi:hypothetical protein M0R19_05645 [Candidatus Pacearchaeota archaeon]|jgi:hypothetical protein|nr:hypothetical protein [Candidatus Pacearchaeota archaeon]